MERKLPKNIRQIGNVSDNPKVYVEDYVDTFITQMSDKAKDGPVGAFLIGEAFRKEEQDYIFIHGAVQMEDVQMKGNEIVLGDRTWKKACEQGKRYFAGNTILGWIMVAPNLQLKLNTNIIKLHERLFMKKSRMLILKDATDKEEAFFVYKYNDLMEIAGHYIYYEKNPEMQDYMIANRKQNCVTPSEPYEDRVTKDFRSAINKRSAEQVQKKKGQKSYAASVALVLIVAVIGVSSINNYEGLRVFQSVAGSVFGNVLGQDTGEDVVANNEIDTTLVTGDMIENDVISDDVTEAEKAEESGTSESGTSESGTSESETSESGTSELETSEPETSESGTSESEGLSDNSGLEEQVDTTLLEETEQDGVTTQDGEVQGDEGVQDEEIAQGDTDLMAQYKEYVVEEYDTLVNICRSYYGDESMVDSVCELNNLEDSDYIYVGQVLQLPY